MNEIEINGKKYVGKTMKEIMEHVPDETDFAYERGYRKGYWQGYITALEDLEEHGAGLRDAIEDWAYAVLQAWYAQSDGEEIEEPPAFDPAWKAL